MHGRVVSTTWLTPSLVRIVLGGEGLEGFTMPPTTDAYVNVAIPPAGAPYGPVFDPRAVREEHERRWWPVRRRYTVRWWDPEAQELAVDFVVHGDEGVAGPWAARAEVGDLLVFEGPGGGYHPRPDAAAYLMVGDESALPAIAASMEAVPAGKRLVVLLLCDGPEFEVPVTSEADLDLRWLHRDGTEQRLLRELETIELPESDVCVFVHGEADEIRGIRRHLLLERRLERSDMSCSPYWRRTMTDEAWREMKKEYLVSMEADVPA